MKTVMVSHISLHVQQHVCLAAAVIMPCYYYMATFLASFLITATVKCKHQPNHLKLHHKFFSDEFQINFCEISKLSCVNYDMLVRLYKCVL